MIRPLNLSTESYLTAMSAMTTLQQDFQALLERESRKVFFRKESEIKRLVFAIGQLERAADELQREWRAA